MFNQKRKSLASTAEAKRFALATAENVAYNYREGMHRIINSEIRRRLEQDVQRELTSVVREFRRAVIGVSLGFGDRDLDTVSGPTRAMGETSARARQRWTPRTPKYMEWKKAQGYGQAWFRNEGKVLRQIENKEAWIRFFGPIKVTIAPSQERVSMANMIAPRSYGKMRLKVATISVVAMQRITSSMLPALTSPRGDINQVGDHDALMRLLPRDVGLRLGGRGAYRPGLEPFLSFVMTRSIPNALYKRIELGFKTRTLRPTVSPA